MTEKLYGVELINYGEVHTLTIKTSGKEETIEKVHVYPAEDGHTVAISEDGRSGKITSVEIWEGEPSAVAEKIRQNLEKLLDPSVEVHAE